MSDEPFYQPFKKPAAVRQPVRGELVWSLRDKRHRQVDCELRDHGQGVGAEIQLFVEREFLVSQRWSSRELALQDAERIKRDYLSQGATEQR